MFQHFISTQKRWWRWCVIYLCTVDPTSALNELPSETLQIYSCCGWCELICCQGCLHTLLNACLSYLYMREVIYPKRAFHRDPWHRWWCHHQWLCNHGDNCRRPGTPACSRNLSDWRSWCCPGQSRPLLVFLRGWKDFRWLGKESQNTCIYHIKRCIFMCPNILYV